MTLARRGRRGTRKPLLAEQLPDRVAQLTAPAAAGGGVGVNSYLHQVWTRRPDLRERWPELDPTGASWLVDWTYRHGYDDVPIPEELLPTHALREPADVGGHAGVTRYLHSVWLRRPDLQRAFPDPGGADATALVEWARTYGRREDAALAAWVDGAPSRRGQRRRPRRGPDGVNVIGQLGGQRGTSEAARLTIRGLDAAGVPLLPVDNAATTTPFPVVAPAEAGFATDLFCLNPHALWRFHCGPGAAVPDHGYSIGYWWWEIPGVVPIEWWVGFELVDEVWAGSDAVAQALETLAPCPVVRVRLPVEPQPAPRLSRAALGLPEGFLFLYAFDYDSNFERKNPLAAIDAFGDAFPDRGAASLVVKCVNSHRHPGEHERLMAAAALHPDVHVIDELLPEPRQRALFAACDCYVSLHRAEGFGLTLAEAMALGKPAIATGWSGNLDYMTPENSYLIGHRLTRVGNANPNYYPPEAQWADPDLSEAAAAMRHVVARPDEAAARGRRGAADLARTHSPAAAGQTMQRRLDELGSRRPLSPRRRRLEAGVLARAAELKVRRRELQDASPRSDPLAATIKI